MTGWSLDVSQVRTVLGDVDSAAIELLSLTERLAHDAEDAQGAIGSDHVVLAALARFASSRSDAGRRVVGRLQQVSSVAGTVAGEVLNADERMAEQTGAVASAVSVGWGRFGGR